MSSLTTRRHRLLRSVRSAFDRTMHRIARFVHGDQVSAYESGAGPPLDTALHRGDGAREEVTIIHRSLCLRVRMRNAPPTPAWRRTLRLLAGRQP